jgi:dihydrofolate reductase
MYMIVSLLVAMDEGGGIGKEGKIPWRLSADLRRFKSLTMGHFILMGRKTYESIGRPLPGRASVVITHNPAYQAEGCLVAYSLEEALRLAETGSESEAFVIGGGEIFVLALPVANRIYLTRVHARTDCDVFFPALDFSEWRELDRIEQEANEKNQFSFTYQVLERKRTD